MFDYYNIFISPEDYESLKKLEGLTGDQAYEKYGYKRDEKISCEFDLGCQYKLTVSMIIPVDILPTAKAGGFPLNQH